MKRQHTAYTALASVLVLPISGQARQRPLSLDEILEAHPAENVGDPMFQFEVVATYADCPKSVLEPSPYDEAKRPKLLCAHGGFAHDPRPGHGQVYWFVRGVGILEDRNGPRDDHAGRDTGCDARPQSAQCHVL